MEPPMELRMQDKHPPLTREAIKDFETRNGLQLPQEVVEFLLAHNGGSFGWDYPAYAIHGHPREEECLLQCFFCLSPGERTDLERVYQVHKGRIPDELLAIASDPGNNLICVGLTGERKGKIYWWERTKERDRPTYDNVFHLADSLKEFLDGLHPFEG
jgi:hypothetical protein